MSPVRKAVIVAAGLGSRMLPATKAVPKELLPIVDKPLIQYAVEEAVAAGITEIVFVIAEGKEAIREHFETRGRVARHAAARGDEQMRRLVEAPAALGTFHYVYQEQALGIAHAIACARAHVQNEPFVVMFPDDLILAHEPCVAQMLRAWEETGGSLIAVQEVPRSEVSQYGVVAPAGEGNPVRVSGIVEKPSVTEAPSNLAVVGRYIVSETIFSHIDRIKPSARGELELTDALASQIAAGEPVSAFRYTGRRFDTGRILGYITASVAAALDRDDLRGPLLAQIRQLTEAGLA